MVVMVAPVSNTNRPGVVPHGPVTVASTMIKSPSVTNGVSSFVSSRNILIIECVLS